mmetsp:Transcript_59892/g.110928  ORF Transcript_59892/g.110928 Transcript_59892/m.110928 type:complete len:525 (-) Transcript_59892:40-1614(-)
MKFRHSGSEAMWQSKRLAWPCALAFLAVLMQGVTVADAAPVQGASSLRQRKTPSPKSLQTDKMALEKDDEEADDDSEDDEESDEDAPVVSAGTATSTPAAVSLGPGGYPELPSISKLFQSATKTLKAVAAQAHMLEERAVEAGKKDEARLSHKKSAYERKLKRQERENRMIEKAVSQTSARIQALRLNNAAIKNHSLALRKSNHLMREELKAIQKRLQTSQEFVGKSLASTDDSNVKELDVLGLEDTQKASSMENEETDLDDSDVDDDTEEDDDSDDTDDGTAAAAPPRQAQTSRAPVLPSVPPPVLQAQLTAPPKALLAMQKGSKDEKGGDEDEDDDDESDDDEAGDDEDEDGNETGTSFLAVRTRRQASKATALAATAGRDILAEISSNVKTLAAEEKKSQQDLQSFFEAAWAAGEHRHEALEAQLTSLNATEVSLLRFQDKLKAAEAHLRKTQGQLEAHLHAEGLFTQRLAHLALAPAVEAPRLLEAVPDHVSLSKGEPAKAKKKVALTGVMPTIVDNTPP